MAPSGNDRQNLFLQVRGVLDDEATQRQVFDALSEEGRVSYRSIHTGVIQVALGDGSVRQIAERFLLSDAERAAVGRERRGLDGPARRAARDRTAR